MLLVISGADRNFRSNVLGKGESGMLKMGVYKRNHTEKDEKDVQQHKYPTVGRRRKLNWMRMSKATGPVVVAALELGGRGFQNDTLRAMLVSKRTPFLELFGREFLEPEI